jgi:hypothetical protein
MDSQQLENRLMFYNSGSPGNWKRHGSGGQTESTTPYVLGEPLVLCFVDDDTLFRAISESATGHYDTSNTGGACRGDGLTWARNYSRNGPIDLVLLESFRLDASAVPEEDIQAGLTYLHDQWDIP